MKKLKKRWKAMKRKKCTKCATDITNTGVLYIREDGKVIKVCKDCHKKHLKERAHARFNARITAIKK